MISEVPKLDDPEASYWIFDSIGKKQTIQRLFCMMTGSVVTSGKGKTSKSKAKAKAKPGAAKKAAKAKGKSSANPDQAAPNLPQEADLQSATVEVSRGVRNKLWIDDALRACNHVLRSLQSMPRFATELDSADLTQAKRYVLRLSLLFAFKGEVVLPTAKGGKVHRRWSTVRPALQMLAAEHLVKALNPINHKPINP